MYVNLRIHMYVHTYRCIHIHECVHEYIRMYLNWSFVIGMVIPPWPDDLKSTISTLARILIGGTQIVCTRAEFGLQVCVDRRGYWWLWVCGCVVHLCIYT